jgi:hypothetical protein
LCSAVILSPSADARGAVPGAFQNAVFLYEQVHALLQENRAAEENALRNHDSSAARPRTPAAMSATSRKERNLI